MEVTVRVLMYGLLLFVPDDWNRPTSMDIVIPDARNPPVASDGCPLHRHTPLLMFDPRGGECPPEHCDFAFGLCRCELERVKIDFRQGGASGCGTSLVCDGTELSTYIPLLPIALVAQSREVRADSIRSFENSSPGDGPVSSHQPRDTRIHGGSPVEQQRSSLITATTDFNLSASPQVCTLSRNGAALVMAPLGNLSSTLLIMQTAEVLQMKLLAARGGKEPMPGTEEDAAKRVLSIWLESFDHARSYKLEVPFVRCSEEGRPDGFCADLILTNMMQIEHAGEGYGRCRPDEVGRDFEILHDLLEFARDQDSRPVPQSLPRSLLDSRYGPATADLAINSGDMVDQCKEHTLSRAFLRDFLRKGEPKIICTGAGAVRPRSRATP